MLALKNRTPFVATIVPFQDKDGRDHAALVVKGTFTIPRAGGEAPIAPEQAPLALGDAFIGEPGLSSTRYESDLGPGKPGTDVVLSGHAISSRAVTELEVELRVARMRKLVRVSGERAYFRVAGGWRISDPQPFVRMPLVYERAFGGADPAAGEPDARPFEPRNPIGTAFVAPDSRRDLEGVALPNLEHPAALIQGPGDRPPPVGFGFIGRSWQPRASFAGSYDDRWRRERCPLLPQDFDARFHHGAPHDQQSPQPLRGGEPVSLTNVAARPLTFDLPRTRIEVEATIKTVKTVHPAALDTVIFEPDEGRCLLTWRAIIPCGRDFLYIDRVEIREA